MNHLPIYLKDLGGEPSWGYLHFSTNLKWPKIQLDFLRNYSNFEHRWALILCCRPIPVFGIPFVDWINLPFLWYLHKKRSIKRDTQTQVFLHWSGVAINQVRKELQHFYHWPWYLDESKWTLQGKDQEWNHWLRFQCSTQAAIIHNSSQYGI